VKSLIVLYSYHHNNTKKVADAMADAIGAAVKSPMETSERELEQYDLIGFGSGIDSGSHYRELLDFANKISPVDGKRCFIFSTSAIQGDKKVANDHAQLREILQSKGYQVAGEFSCLGYNTNSFLKYIGGMNKGKPGDVDINHARAFALNLLADQNES
jgi:flavodoxin